MSRFLTAALYKFVSLEDFAQLREPLFQYCQERQIKGTLLLAREGINGTLAGPPEGVRQLLGRLRSDPRLSDLEHKESWTDREPFYRLKVKIKKEIVTLGVPGIEPHRMAGQYVQPEQWNELIAQPDVVLIDTRNDYEFQVGTFQGAVNPKTRSFSELPHWVETQMQPGGLLAEKDGRKPRVAMFCTGGIRCEKSTAFIATSASASAHPARKRQHSNSFIEDRMTHSFQSRPPRPQGGPVTDQSGSPDRWPPTRLTQPSQDRVLP